MDNMFIAQIIIFALIGVLFIAIVIMLMYSASLKSKLPPPVEETDYQYQQRPGLMTKSEFAFYKVLVPLARERNMLVFAKVRIADIIEPRKSTINRNDALQKIGQKHVDFLLCDAKVIKPVLAVELDDEGHGKKDADEFIDTALQSAELQVVYAKSTEDLTEQLEEILKIDEPDDLEQLLM